MAERDAAGVPASPLAACGERIAHWLGLQLPPARLPELARALARAAPDLGCDDLRSCVQHCLLRPLDERLLDALAPQLTVGETYFFRDPSAFAALREHILPPLLRARAGGTRALRLWSAGCSTGEEAYSLAITIAQALPGDGAWTVDVLATDLNPRALAAARQGVYRDWSFRGTAPELRARHFRHAGKGAYRIDPRLQAMVRFRLLNLAEDVYPAADNGTGAMDVVFCRNVLMYLQPVHAAAVVARLERCLADGGWLVVSPVETPLVSASALRPLHLPGLVIFRKGQGTAAVPARAAVSGEGPAASAPVAPVAPRDPSAAVAAATAHYAAERYADAAAVLETAVAHAPEQDRAMLLLARALANLGRLDEALGWCERALAADRLDPQRSYLHGSILLELGREDEAAAAFRRSLYLDPEHPLAQFALGNLLARRERPAEAARHYRRVRELLRGLPRERALPEADGVAAGHLLEIVEAILEMEAGA